jgi:SAM-dependent methyltransferase
VLDLASGSGRHARLLAGLGHEVTAVDRDAGSLAAVADLPRVRALRSDLEDGGPWPFAGTRFAAIVVTNYLHRPLFPAIRDALAPGGVLIYETFMLGNERFGKPSNADFLLRAGELWTVFGASLEVRAYEQGFQRSPKPAMIQRLCAIHA